jgi:hypothetical protein
VDCRSISMECILPKLHMYGILKIFFQNMSSVNTEQILYIKSSTFAHTSVILYAVSCLISLAAAQWPVWNKISFILKNKN